MKYIRPEIKQVEENFLVLLKNFENADTLEHEINCIEAINKLRNHFFTMATIASINYSIDTTIETNQKEQDYFDNIDPVFEELENKYYRTLLKSKFRNELNEKFGSLLFRIAEMRILTSDEKIIEEKKKENHLRSEYMKLRASAKILFDGKDRNLQELEPYMESSDRETRRAAFIAYWNFYSEHSEEFDGLFDKLVKLRQEMALKMGYRNYIKLGYADMMRFDYNENDVKVFRENIKKYFVPVVTKFREKQRKRLGLDELMVYDLFIQFNSGNAKPKGNPEWILERGKEMFDEFSRDTSEFYNFMMENNLMDVESRKGKDLGGFCTFINDYNSPFIFSNMNGTHGDITVLTHEAGHAFQAYKSRDINLLEYKWPTAEACEVHSMSLEFLTHPWMNLFFEENTDKFKFEHLLDSLNFLPYGVLVDDFQHWIYENPEAAPQERNSKWRELEKVYMPHLKYGEIEYLEKGTRWQKQGHIYQSPFYYIDYCLAQICAFQFWSKAIHNNKNGNFDSALKDYIRLCEMGGKNTFLELVKETNLDSPFDEKVIKKIAEEVDSYLESIDELKL